MKIPIIKKEMLADIPISKIEGVSIYNNVVVFWDDDFDGRVLEFLDWCNGSTLKEIIAVSERKGTLSVFVTRIIDELEDGFEPIGGDYFNIIQEMCDSSRDICFITDMVQE